VETVVSSKVSNTSKSVYQSTSKPVSLSSIPFKKTGRISTKISELDRVLGGGLVSGQVVLLAGEPGIGKSTLLIEVADKLGNTLYVSGEESTGQLAIRAGRLGIKNKSVSLLEETDVDAIIAGIEQLGAQEQLRAVIIDSVQTMSTSDLSGLAGSVGQVRECTFRFLKMAKAKNFPLFLVGHVTKEGTVAGPSVLAHIVDTILWFEGDKTQTIRLVRAVKNRFGPTDEVGVFQMEETGLISQTNSEKIFLSHGLKQVPGSVVTSTLSGSRPLLVEIQSLVVPSKMAFPKRASQGILPGRLELLLAVLIRRCGLPLYEDDVFVNVAGGIRVDEPGADLATCLSIASSYFDKAVPRGTLAVGEVGLLGEIREVPAQEKRIKEAKRLGFHLPITSREVKYLSEAIKRYLR
jgi:DNA repair protein RadA/Sms